MIIVVLTDDEIAEVEAEARRRHRESEARNFANHAQTVRSYELDYTGALGERCVAKYMDLPWTGAGRDHYDPEVLDVEPYEVKTSNRYDDLFIKSETRLHRSINQIYIQCRALDEKTVRINGWQTLEFALNCGLYRRPYDCYTVPWRHLRHMIELTW